MDGEQKQLAARLLHLTKHKAICLERIVEITKNQTQAIDNDNTELLHKLLSEKQDFINTINGLDREFNEIYSEFGHISVSSIAVLQSEVLKVQKLTEMMYILEKDNFDKINKSIDQVKRQLKGINTGKRGLNAYKIASVPQEARNIDRTK